jgi:hypothetical protein
MMPWFQASDAAQQAIVVVETIRSDMYGWRPTAATEFAGQLRLPASQRVYMIMVPSSLGFLARSTTINVVNPEVRSRCGFLGTQRVRDRR